MKKGKFKVPIYDANVEVVVLENMKKLDEYYRQLRKKLKYEKDEDEGLALGLVLSKGRYIYLLLSEDKLNINLCSHECTHIVYSLLGHHSIPIENSEEVFAILTGFINENVFNILEKLGCKIIKTYK